MFPSGWGMYDLYGRRGLPVDPTPAKKVGKQHEDNKLEILAQGNRVRVAVNGTQVIDWRDPLPDRIKEGPIGLQLHSQQGAPGGPLQGHRRGDLPEGRPAPDRQGRVTRSSRRITLSRRERVPEGRVRGSRLDEETALT